MRAVSNPPDLATLRELCGQPISFDSSIDKGQQVRPGLWRKVYGPLPKQCYMLRPTRWKLRSELKDLRASEEIAKHVDERPLLQLKDGIDKLMQQVVARAAAGDERAINVLVSSARGVVAALETIARIQPEKLQTIAEVSVNWPVLLSPNPQDIKDANNRVSRLRVGTKATTPRRRGQRLNPGSFWTELATMAFQSCQDNKNVFVPELRAHCQGIKPKRKHLPFWRTTIEANFYYVSPTDCIVITVWEENCVKLSLPVTTDNLTDWWTVIKHYVLEYWVCFPQEYKEALQRIGQPGKEECFRRNMAVDRVEQSFRSLVRVR